MERVRKKSRAPSKRLSRTKVDECGTQEETEHLLPDSTKTDVTNEPIERKKSQNAPLPSEVSFEDVPVFTICNHCGEKVVTKTSFKRGKKMLCASACLCLLQCYCCFWIPLVLDALKDVVHTCPKCNKEIAIYHRFQIPLFKKKGPNLPRDDDNL